MSSDAPTIINANEFVSDVDTIPGPVDSEDIEPPWCLGVKCLMCDEMNRLKSNPDKTADFVIAALDCRGCSRPMRVWVHDPR